jgi:hypothetical protein
MLVRLESIEEIRHSYPHNRRYRVTWSEPGVRAQAAANTAAHAPYVHEITYGGFAIGEYFHIEVNGRGTVAAMRAATTEELAEACERGHR